MQDVSKQSPGERYLPLSPAPLENPYPFEEQARRAQEPIFFSPALNAYVVTRMKDVYSLLADEDMFASNSLIHSIEQPYSHTFHMLSQDYTPAPVTRVLSAVHVKSMELVIWETANMLVDAFINDGHADLMSQFARPLTGDVVCDFCGIAQPDRAMVMAACDGALEMISTADTQVQAEAASHMVALHKLLTNYVVHRRATPQADFISDIIATLAPGSDPLPIGLESELVQYLSSFLLAAHEGTGNMIGDGIRLLLDHPDRWHALRQEPDSIPAMVEELVRFSSPEYAFFRRAVRDVVVGDEADGTAIKLPAGTQFLLVSPAANHERAAFPDAELFERKRLLKGEDQTDSGYENHFCVGMPEWHMEVEIALEVLTQRLPQLRLVPGQSFARQKTLISRGLKRLDVVW